MKILPNFLALSKNGNILAGIRKGNGSTFLFHNKIFFGFFPYENSTLKTELYLEEVVMYPGIEHEEHTAQKGKDKQLLDSPCSTITGSRRSHLLVAFLRIIFSIKCHFLSA